MHLQAQLESGYVVTATRSSSFSPFSSLRCLWASTDKKIYSAYERPPFPIKVDAPTWGQIWKEFRMSDLFMGATIYGTGLCWAYFCSKPFTSMMQRLVVYHGVSHMFLAVSLSLMITVPFRRLTGFWDNGLRWKKPEDRLNKYDCTSHFEKSTGWSKWRINTRE